MASVEDESGAKNTSLNALTNEEAQETFNNLSEIEKIRELLCNVLCAFFSSNQVGRFGYLPRLRLRIRLIG